MKKAKVSVIIPVYNVEEYIRKCLDSLVNQTLKDIEIIVVNDGSPDNSQDIIDEYVEKYPKKIKSFIKENGGQGSARNFGLEHATGEYIGYVDSDDYVDISMYEKLYTNAKKNKSDISICGTYVVAGEKLIEELEPMFFSDKKKNAFFGKKAVWNKIYKKELIIDNKLEFRSKIWYEDFDFSFKALSAANKVSYINEPLYYYLIRPGSTMNNSNIHRNLEIIEAFEQIKNIKANKDIQEFLAIDHIYISTIVRIIRSRADKNTKKDVINEILTYFKKNFPKYRNNKYLNILTKNRKIIFELLERKMYFLIALLFKIKR